MADRPITSASGVATPSVLFRKDACELWPGHRLIVTGLTFQDVAFVPQRLTGEMRPASPTWPGTLSRKRGMLNFTRIRDDEDLIACELFQDELRFRIAPEETYGSNLWAAWDLRVSDDVGTSYNRGSAWATYGDQGGVRWIGGRIPPNATLVRISIRPKLAEAKRRWHHFEVALPAIGGELTDAPVGVR